MVSGTIFMRPPGRGLLLGLRPVAFVMPPGFHPVAAGGHRAPAGLVRLAAVEQEQPAFFVAAGTQAARQLLGEYLAAGGPSRAEVTAWLEQLRRLYP